MTRREIRFIIGTADWTKFVLIADAGRLTGRLEARESAGTGHFIDQLRFKLNYVLFLFNLTYIYFAYSR